MTHSQLVAHTIEIPEGKHVLHILSSVGDDTLVYDPTVDKEVAAVMKTFDEAMKRGMMAYAYKKGSDTATVTRDFNEVKQAERTVLVPQIVGG